METNAAAENVLSAKLHGSSGKGERKKVASKMAPVLILRGWVESRGK